MRRGPRSPARWVALALLAGPACGTGTSDLNRLHGPMDVAYLPAGAFFEQPVAYVTNWRSGTIAKLDLRRFDMLVEDEPGAWIGSPPLATGADRVLDQVAVSTDSLTFVDVLATDAARDELLLVPHLRTAEDGSITTVEPVVSEGPTYQPAEGSAGGEVRLDGLQLLTGATTTESWTLTFDGSAWHATGSASGPQVVVAVPGVPYETAGRELRFTVDHGGTRPAEGSTISLSTDTGVRAAPLFGYAQDLLVTPGTRWLLVAEQTTGADGGPQGQIAVFDPRSLDRVAELALPSGARPSGMSLDREGDAVWVGDYGDLGLIHRVDLVSDEPSGFPVVQIPVPGPVLDVAVGRDPGRELVFAAAADAGVIYLLDAATGVAIDWNVATVGVDPIEVRSPVAGLAATADPIDLNTRTDWGAVEEVHAVVAATLTGHLRVYRADDGCESRESDSGAYLETDSSGSTTLFQDLDPPSNPSVEADPETGALASFSSCGGVTPDEIWTLTFDAGTRSYAVEGTVSGVQEGPAFEDVRYVSDGGEFSILVRSGTLATTDGDRFILDVNDGVSPIPLQELPGDPLVYTDEFGDRSSPWYNVAAREAAVVPHAGNDVVMWIDIQGYGDGGLQYFQ